MDKLRRMPVLLSILTILLLANATSAADVITSKVKITDADTDMIDANAVDTEKIKAVDKEAVEAIIAAINEINAKTIDRDTNIGRDTTIETTPIPVSGCTVITNPGTYTLTADILGSVTNPCIAITSSDVTFDGAGHYLDGQNTATGIYVWNPQTALTNVNVKNTKLTDWYIAVRYRATIFSNLSGNQISTSTFGFYFDDYSGRNKFVGNQLISNSYGFYMWTGYNTFIGNILTSNSNGFNIQTSDRNTFTDNVANDNYNAFYLQNSQWNILNKNTANKENSGTGFYLYNSHNNTLTNNIAKQYRGFLLQYARKNTLVNNDANGSNRGIELDYNPTTNNTIKSNNLSGKEYGILLYDADYNTIKGNAVRGASSNGIWTQYSDNNLIYDNIFNNSNNFFNQGASTNIWDIDPKSCVISIVNGPEIAGNVWDNPTKTGFSQICGDDEKDGICDSANPLDSSNIDYFPLVHKATGDKTPPSSVSNLHNTTYAYNYIKWAWVDPINTDFSYVKVFIDGNLKCGILKTVQLYNATGFLPNTSHTIGTKTVDTSGNEAALNTHTAKTKPDSIAPGTVTNLKNVTYAQTYINWTWKDPIDYDLQYIKVWIDGTFKANVLKGKQLYSATGFTPGTTHKISTRAQDTSGNLGAWTNHTAKTKS